MPHGGAVKMAAGGDRGVAGRYGRKSSVTSELTYRNDVLMNSGSPNGRPLARTSLISLVISLRQGQYRIKDAVKRDLHGNYHVVPSHPCHRSGNQLSHSY